MHRPGLSILLPLLMAAAGTHVAPASAQVPTVTVPECGVDAGIDTDGDGLSDVCEFALARRFAPILMVRSGGCDWDASVQPARLGGGYFHAVQPVEEVVRVAYLPAWFRDCGWQGPKCLLPWIDCSPHDGDSEMIIVELQAETRVDWRVTGVFLSAHCFGRSAGSCRWYRGRRLEPFEWHDSSPVVWVAEGRHANYPTWQACDRGHRSTDTCDRHDLGYHFPVDATRNIGSRHAPAPPDGCVTGAQLESAAVDPDARECFWDAATPFRGWQRDAAGVTPYERYLRAFAEF